MQNTHASFSKEWKKNDRTHQGEDQTPRKEKDRKVFSELTCGKRTLEACLFELSPSTGKTSGWKIVYSEPKNTVLKSLSAGKESQMNFRERKQKNTKSFQRHFAFD